MVQTVWQDGGERLPQTVTELYTFQGSWATGSRVGSQSTGSLRSRLVALPPA